MASAANQVSVCAHCGRRGLCVRPSNGPHICRKCVHRAADLFIEIDDQLRDPDLD
jgi:hypothetical protein